MDYLLLLIKHQLLIEYIDLYYIIVLKLPIRTNNNKLRNALGIPDIKTYLYLKLQKFKNKYEMNYKEKLKFYNKININNSIIDNLN